MLKFSIITACLNRSDLIGDAVESVLAQDYPEVEHLIVDGGSTDGTLELLELYPHLDVVSEPDEGIYDAWNKGLSRCTGDVIGILNSDDMYASGVFVEVARALESGAAVELVTGSAIQFVEEGDAWRVVSRYEETPGPTLDPARLIFWGPIINARFLRAEAYLRVGVYDSGYRIASDCDFMLRLARQRPRCVYLDRCVYFYRTHPASVSLNEHGANDRTSYSEKLSVAETWLCGDTLSAVDWSTVRRRHSEMSAIATLSFMFRSQPKVAAEFFRRGSRWAVSFTMALASELLRIAIYQVTKRVRRDEMAVMAPAAGRSARKRDNDGGGKC